MLNVVYTKKYFSIQILVYKMDTFLSTFSQRNQDMIHHEVGLASDKIVKNTPFLLSKYWEQICSSVVCHASGRHGVGLFATDNIQAFQIVTLYPVHWLAYRNNTTNKQCTIDTGGASIRPPPSTHADYTFGIREPETNLDKSIIGDPRIVRPGWMGHMINDVDSISMQPTSKEILEYCETYAIANVVPITISNLRIALVSVRDIPKGEEILFSYGPSYWAGHARTGSREIEGESCQALLRNYWHISDNTVKMVYRGISEHNHDLAESLTVCSMSQSQRAMMIKNALSVPFPKNTP